MSLVDPTQPVDYASDAAPTSYRCQPCGASDCKLWRYYNAFLDNQTLLCAICASTDSKVPIDDLDEHGRHTGEFGPTDQIGSYIPAIPTAENDTFWGYTSVPNEGVLWWRRLPSRPTQETTRG